MRQGLLAGRDARKDVAEIVLVVYTEYGRRGPDARRERAREEA